VIGTPEATATRPGMVGPFSTAASAVIAAFVFVTAATISG
jgi:hypothetical protein